MDALSAMANIAGYRSVIEAPRGGGELQPFRATLPHVHGLGSYFPAR